MICERDIVEERCDRLSLRRAPAVGGGRRFGGFILGSGQIATDCGRKYMMSSNRARVRSGCSGRSVTRCGGRSTSIP